MLKRLRSSESGSEEKPVYLDPGILERACFSSVVENSSDAVICTDSLGKVIYWNIGAKKMFGYADSEILGNSIDLIIPDEVRDKHAQGIKRAVQTGVIKKTGQVSEVQGLRKGGTFFPLEISVNKWENRNAFYFTAILRDITEQKMAQAELLKKSMDLIKINDELKKVSNYKSKFLTNMSHELRTPLTSILLLTDELLSTALGELNITQFEYLRDIQGSAQELLGLINELLDFSKIEAGKVIFSLADVEISGVLRGIIKKVGALARSKQINIKCDICSRRAIIANSKLIEQLVSNLLINAIKFSPRSSSIKIYVKDVSNPVLGITITIIDAGPGIPECEQGKIFEPFYQVTAGPARVDGGTGLGLAMVKKIADLHTGSVSIESREGQGAAFTVFLPLHPNLDNNLA